MAYNSSADLCELDVVVLVTVLLFLDEQCVDLLEERRPHLIGADFQ